MTFIDDMVRSAQKPKTKLGKTVEEHKRRRAEAIAPTEAILAEIQGLMNQGNYSEAYRKYEQLPIGDQMAIAVSPAVGDLIAMYEVPTFSSRAMQNIQEGDYLGAAGNFGLAGLAGLSTVPFFGLGADAIKTGITGLRGIGRTAKIPEGEGMGVGGSGPANIDPAPSKVETTHLKDNQVSETQDSSWMSLLQDRILKTVDTRNLDPDKPYSFQFIKESVLKDNPPGLHTKLNKQFTDYTSEGIEDGGKITFRELISDIGKNEPSFYENISEAPRLDGSNWYQGREEYTPRFLNPKANEGELDYVAPSEYVERNLSVIPANLTEGQVKNMPIPEDFHEMIGQSPYTRLDGTIDIDYYGNRMRPADPNRIFHSRSGIYDFGEQGKKYVAAEHQSDMYGFYNKTSELTHLQDWATKSDHFDNLQRADAGDPLYGDFRVNLEEELIKNPEEAIKVMDEIVKEGVNPEEAAKAIREIAGDIDRKTTERMYKKLELPYRGETEFTPEAISNTWRNMTPGERLAHAQSAEDDILKNWESHQLEFGTYTNVEPDLNMPESLLISDERIGPISDNNRLLAMRRNLSNRNLEYDSSTPYIFQAEHPLYTTPEAPWYENFDPLLQQERRIVQKDATKQLEKYLNLELPESRAPLFDEWFNLSVKRNLNHAANSDANSILFPIDAKSVRRQRGETFGQTKKTTNMAQTYKSRTENALKNIAAEYDINLTEHLGRFEDPQGGTYIELTLTPELREAFQKTLYNKGGAVYKVPLMTLKY